MDMNKSNGITLFRDFVARQRWKDQELIGRHLLEVRGVLIDDPFQ